MLYPKDSDIIDTRGRLLTSDARKKMGGGTRFKKKHGMKNTPEYFAWISMLNRCYNPHTRNYNLYGGRGITVCDRWKNSFMNFYSDMGSRPNGMSLDRKDNNGDYTPDNCRWVTGIVQQRNKRNNHIIVVGGQSMCLAEAAERYGIRKDTLARRLKYGWTVEKAVATSVRVYCRRC